MIGTKPKVFKRGGDFSIILNLPAYVEANFFQTWQAQAQLRRYQDDTSRGLISDLVFEWIPDTDHKSFRLKATNTANWPLGPAELDVMFVKDEATTYTATMLIQIERGITKRAA